MFLFKLRTKFVYPTKFGKDIRTFINIVQGLKTFMNMHLLQNNQRTRKKKISED